MEIETTSNGFVLKLGGQDGLVIEWMANKDEILILLPPRDPAGRINPDGQSYVVRVKRHPRTSPSVSVYPVDFS